MSGHTYSFRAHGQEIRVHADRREHGIGTIFHLTAGLMTVCMCMEREEMREFAHVLTMAVDDAYAAEQRAEVEA